MRRKLALPAKLVRPTQAGTYQRARLFALLDRARPVAWVSGPPGAGKTTLVASYVEARRLRPVWYQVDQGDSDVATLFYYLRLAAVRAAPRKRWRLPLLTPEYLPGLDTFTRRWFEEFFAGLFPRSLLVFDNYQEVAASSLLHDVARAALESLPPGQRVLIVSRSDPPSALARLRAEGRLELIDWDDLRLTSLETAGLARMRIGERLSADRVRSLHAATGGWAAGLVLMLERTAAEQSRTVEAGRLPQAVFDYFAAEILAHSDAETRQVLLETSLLPKITAAQSEALTQLPRSSTILAELARRRYFTDTHADPEPTYQYHPLFREFLLARAREQLPRERRDELRRRAAALLEQSGQIEDAANLHREARDWQALGRLALANAPALLSTGRGATLEAWLCALPPEELDESPWLLYWLGVCRLHTSAEDSEAHAERAYEHFAARGDRVGVLAAASLAIDAVLDHWTNLRRLDRWIAALEMSLSGMSQGTAEALENHAVASLFAALIWRRPEHPEIARWADRTHAILRTTNDPALRARLAVTVGHHLMWAGEIETAGAIADSLEVGAKPDTPVATRLWVMVLQAHLAWIKADVARCRDIVAKALAIAENEGVRVVDAMLVQAGAYGALVEGDVAAARVSLARIRAGIEDSQLARLAQHLYLASWASFLDGDLPAAHAQAEEAERVAAECGVPFGVMVCRLALAQTLFERGLRVPARERLGDALAIARAIHSRHAEQLCLLVDADFAFREENEAAGLQATRSAFAIGREHGLLAGGWSRPDLLGRLCTRALAAGVETDFARRLVRAHRLQPDTAVPPPERWPWPIRIRALGTFEAELDDRPVLFAGKAQRKPIALLKAVVAFGGRAVREQDVADALWPDAEGDAAHQALAVTLHRLRRLLRDDRAIRRHEGRLELDSTRVWSDVSALESTLQRAAQAASDERVRLVESALQLYRGPLLADDEDEAWTVAPRERLRARVVREVDEMARSFESTEPDRAASWYLKALDVDGRAEDLYRRLIGLYQRLGRRAEALGLYERCRAVLRVSAGVPPSPETEALARMLRAGSS